MVGKTIGGKYKVLQSLDNGQFGEALLVQDGTGTKFVAKRIFAKPSPRVYREVDLLRSLTHPYVIKCIESFEENDSLYIVMEYATGDPSDLAKVIKKRGALPEAEVLPIFKQIADAVAYCHDPSLHGGVVAIHRDIKPENILVMSDGRMRLADWGAGRFASEEDTRAAMTVIGTRAYLAPEIVAEDVYSELVDVYSLGRTIMHLLTGERPPIEKQPALPKATSRGMRTLLGAMTMPDPQNRFNIFQVVDALAQFKVPGRWIQVYATKHPTFVSCDIGAWLTRIGYSGPIRVQGVTCEDFAARAGKLLAEVDGLLIGGRENARVAEGLAPLDRVARLICDFHRKGGAVVFLHESMSESGEWAYFCNLLGMKQVTQNPTGEDYEGIVVEFALPDGHPLRTVPYDICGLAGGDGGHFKVEKTHCGRRMMMNAADVAEDAFAVRFCGRAKGQYRRYLVLGRGCASIEAGHSSTGNLTTSEVQLFVNLMTCLTSPARS